MKKLILIAVLGISSALPIQAQTFQWVREFVSTGYAQGNGIATDPSGNVILTGSFQGTVDMDPGPGVLNMTSAGQTDTYVCKLDPNGNLVWAVHIAGPQDCIGNNLRSDSLGNIIFCGGLWGSADFDPGPGVFTVTAPMSWGDLFICKLDPAGNFLWAKNIGGPDVDLAYDLEVDAAGNIYTGGWFNQSVDFDPGPGAQVRTAVGNDDAFVLKLDGGGNFVWVSTVGGTSYERCNELAVDATGNVYYCGEFRNTVDFDPGPGTMNLTSTGQEDIFVSKLTATGSLAWVKQTGGTSIDRANGIALDASGNIVYAGIFTSTADFDPGPGTLNFTSPGGYSSYYSKLDGSGNLLWAKAVMSGGSIHQPNSMMRDAAGNFVAWGIFSGTQDFDPGPGISNFTSNGNYDFFALKLDDNGNYVWAATAGGWELDLAHTVAVHGTQIYGTGYFRYTVDFDPGPGVYNLTGTSWDRGFIWKLGNCTSPSPPVNTNPPAELTICAGDSVTLTATGSGTLTWYNVPSGGTSLGSGNNINTGPLFSPVTYYVQDSTCAASSRTAIALTILQSSASSFATSACGSYSSPSGTYVWTSSGTYMDTLTNAAGCDSVITIGLTVLQPTGATLSDSACHSYLSPSGNHLWTASGTYTDTVVNSMGCDSMITVNLTILNTVSTISATACGSYISPSGQIWTSSGTYLDTIPNLAGCDSVITVNLILHNVSASTLNDTGCNSYTSPSGAYTWTTSGTYSDTLQNSLGCDSVITVHLTMSYVDVTVTNTSPTLISNAVGATYQWIYCDSVFIPGATNQSFTAVENGNYAVIVSLGGCTDTSACESVGNVSGLEDGTWKKWQAYPNPTSGHVKISWEEGDVDAVEVCNAWGQVISEQIVEDGKSAVLELKGTPGIYFVGLRSEAGGWTFIKVVKR